MDMPELTHFSAENEGGCEFPLQCLGRGPHSVTHPVGKWLYKLYFKHSPSILSATLWKDFEETTKWDENYHYAEALFSVV